MPASVFVLPKSLCVVINPVVAVLLRLLRFLLTICIGLDIPDYSTAVEIFHLPTDPACPILARSLFSKSRKTSQCGSHTRRAVPQ